MFVFMPILQAANDYYGYTGFMLIYAAISAHACVLGALYRPSALEHHCKLDTLSSNAKQRTMPFWKRFGHHFRVCTEKGLLCFCGSLFCLNLGTYLVFLHLPKYAILEGSTPMQASWLLSVAGISTIVACVALGLAANSDNIDERIVYSGRIGILALVTVIFPLFSNTYPGQVAFAIMLGSYSNGPYATVNTLTIDLVGVNMLAPAFGLEMLFSGCGILLGPSLAGMFMFKSMYCTKARVLIQFYKNK
jgi:hypothetical protein